MTQQGPQQPPPQKQEPFDYMGEILRRAGLVNEDNKPDPSLAPIGLMFSWGKSVWHVEEAVPIERFRYLGIFAMFQSEEEVRVYALPRDTPPEGSPATPCRFTLCKGVPNYFVEVIATPDLLMDEVADELRALLGMDDDFPIDEEDEWEDEEEGEEDEEEQPDEQPPPPPQR